MGTEGTGGGGGEGGEEGERSGCVKELSISVGKRSTRYSGILCASGKKHRIFWDFGRLRKEA